VKGLYGVRDPLLVFCVLLRYMPGVLVPAYTGVLLLCLYETGALNDLCPKSFYLCPLLLYQIVCLQLSNVSDGC
jgi:hypothetical protein